jgi:hypothetical protein
MTRRLAALVLFAGVLFGAPRPSEAALMDFIWGLSGPQLIGAGFGCRFGFEGKVRLERCIWGTPPAPAKADLNRAWKRVYFSVGGSAFVSTGKDSDTNVDYRWFDVGMLAFEPSMSFNSGNPGGVRIFHGIGPTYDVLFGLRRDFPTFDKLGIRVTPVELDFDDQRAVVALTVRLYPNGFTDDEFGVGQRVDVDRPFETVVGVSFGYSFRSRR